MFCSDDCRSWPREENINNHGCWGKHAHIPDNIIYITVLENRIICCQIFCDLLLKSAFERILNVMQLILVKIKWHIKWKYLIQKFHDICLSHYFNVYTGRTHMITGVPYIHTAILIHLSSLYIKTNNCTTILFCR
jgi:hypothetical protein